MNLAIGFIAFFFSCKAYAQDSTFFKSAYAGSYLVVPQDESWQLDRVFINDGDAYSIQVGTSNFRGSYHGGDTIRVPYYIAEMELLSKKEMVQYYFYFKKR